MFQKSHIKAPTQDALPHNQNCKRLAFQEVKTQHVEPGRPFIWWEGGP